MTKASTSNCHPIEWHHKVVAKHSIATNRRFTDRPWININPESLPNIKDILTGKRCSGQKKTCMQNNTMWKELYSCAAINLTSRQWKWKAPKRCRSWKAFCLERIVTGKSLKITVLNAEIEKNCILAPWWIAHPTSKMRNLKSYISWWKSEVFRKKNAGYHTRCMWYQGVDSEGYGQNCVPYVVHVVWGGWWGLRPTLCKAHQIKPIKYTKWPRVGGIRDMQLKHAESG